MTIIVAALFVGMAFVGCTALVANTAYQAFLKFLEFKAPKNVKLPIERVEELEAKVNRINLALGIRTIPMQEKKQ